MILNANNPASWGQYYLINNQAKPCCWLLVALSEFTWNAGKATEMRHWAASKAVCVFIAAVGLDMRNNSVAEQCHGRDPNLLQSPWALSQLSLVTKGLINCFNLLCSFFLLFPHPFWTFFCLGFSKLTSWFRTLLGDPRSSVCLLPHMKLQFRGVAQKFSHLWRARSILGNKILNPGCGSQE